MDFIFMEKASSKKRLIDANALIKEANADGAYGYVDAKQIADAPTVDAVEVVHGRWLGWGKSGTPTYENYGTCSVCGEDAEIYTEHRNYCPNCGAKMDGGEVTRKH